MTHEILSLKESCGFSGHTIVCGWNDCAPWLVEELAVQGGVVILSPKNPGFPNTDRIISMTGNPTFDEDLNRAGVQKASSAVILAETGHDLPPDVIDARTLLTALAVKTLNPRIYTVMELLNPANERHARRARVDDLILRDQTLAHVTASSIAVRGMASFWNDLLCRSDKGSSFVSVPVETHWENRTVGELFASLRAQGKLPLGCLRPGETGWVHEINPREDGPVQLPLKIVCIERNQKR